MLADDREIDVDTPPLSAGAANRFDPLDCRSGSAGVGKFDVTDVGVSNFDVSAIDPVDVDSREFVSGDFMGLLLFKKCFAAPIRRGTKRMTLRRWDRPRVSAGRKAFCPGLGYLQIESVDPVEWADLGEDDALADGFASLSEMRAMLLSIYPDQSDGKRWWRVRFTWIEPEETGLFRKKE